LGFTYGNLDPWYSVCHEFDPISIPFILQIKVQFLLFKDTHNPQICGCNQLFVFFLEILLSFVFEMK
jgi:hypothetical protein